MTFKRKIYDKFLEWKKNSDGKTALLVEGARRIGKSTIVEEFAKNEYESYILIDFTKASKEVLNLFDDISDLNYIFLRLQLIYHKELHQRKSLIIFDEVQFCPKARQAIKHLVADHRYDYMETGSLISIRKNVKDILIPSEERQVQMYPMDFEEFKWALGDTVTIKLLRESFEKYQPLGDDLNRRMMRDFRLYMLVGGMPKAVSTYIETNNMRLVDEEKRDILRLYESDFMKIDSTGKAAMLFKSIPSQLEKNASRYQVSSVLENQRNSTVLELISEMESSKTVLVSYKSDDPNAGLTRTKDLENFKLFVCDTGLFTTMLFMDKDFTENIIYEKLLSDKLSVNLGYLYENVVAQILKANGNSLFYYTFLDEKSRHNFEIDFLLARNNKVCPIEIKSSGYKTHASLDAFSEKYSSRIFNKYLVYTKDLGKDKDVFSIPVYMTMFL
ncbi:MAG: AAA family ATPase [Treponema succinifaciens]|uniref:ATP-binding protein n=1 Tax=Treponema succinifaciens TaxID=167 RepID=UPI0023F182C9|nr:AAA family ATPase [Treponema succinifaciens]MDD6962301.1 AAA family ATPase [Treponema succinifaciens]